MPANGAITWTNERRTLEQLTPWEANPRQIKEDQAERLVGSYEDFNQVNPLAIEPDNTLLNGHQRRNVWLKKYGSGLEVDVRVASRKLTMDERKKLTIYLHEGATGEWDFDMMANIFELDELTEWGFPEWKLADVFAPDDPPADVAPQMDRAEELREKFGVESGQLWRLGDHRLICGNCTDAAVVERVMGGEKAQVVIADPPYWNNSEIMHNQIGVVALAFDMARARCDGVMYWFWDNITSPPFSEKVNARHVWYKTNGWQAGHWEAINEYRGNDERGESLVYPFPNVGTVIRDVVGKHPTPKPPSLIEIFCTKNLIYDPFLGSGTTLIACERLNRKCYGVEIEPKYVAVTLQRWADVTGREPELIT